MTFSMPTYDFASERQFDDAVAMLRRQCCFRPVRTRACTWNGHFCRPTQLAAPTKTLGAHARHRPDAAGF